MLVRTETTEEPDVSKLARTTAPLHPLLAARWSPRSFDPEHELGASHVRSLLEAARWAPSSSNSQPWRFLVGRRGEPAHAALSEALVEGNRRWATAASALVLVAAEVVSPEGRPRSHAGYDTGAAVAQLTIQAEADGLAVHQMAGFDGEAVRRAFGLEERLTPMVVLAVGVVDPEAGLPEDLATREVAERTRKPIEELLLDSGQALPLSA